MQRMSLSRRVPPSQRDRCSNARLGCQRSTVPAASRRLQLLEHPFKASLFERHSRGITLTLAGERLLQLAREVIASVHHMRAQMGNCGHGQQSVLRVHGNTSAMTQFLPGDIAAFQSAQPQVRVVLEECWSEDAVRRVRGRDRPRRDCRRTRHQRPGWPPLSP
jgi:DNA-binding transcriptional LysR family regulator